MEESELEKFQFQENLYDRREQDHHKDRTNWVPNDQDREDEDHETVVKIEESGESQSYSVSVEPTFQSCPDQTVTFKSEDPCSSQLNPPVIPGPSVQTPNQTGNHRELVPMYQGAVKLSFGREIILGPSKKFGTNNQTSYRIVTLSKYECDVCQFSYVGENVNKLKGRDTYQLFIGCNRHFTVVFTIRTVIINSYLGTHL